MNQFPQVTQEQKDAIFIYRAITEQQKIDNLFTAHKFYQRFVKRDEFLFPRQGGNHLKFNAPRFTPEYIYLRLLELSKLGLCELQADVYALTAPTEEDFNNPLLQLNKDGYSMESCGMNVVAISDDGAIEPLPHLGNSLSFLPIVPMDYPYTKPNEVTSVMDIEKAMPVMCFFFNIENKINASPSRVSSQPIIINIKNTTDKLQSLQLFRKQSIPSGVEISSGLPNVSIDDMLYEIQHEKNNVERTMLYIIRENKIMAPHESYFGYLKSSDMIGNMAARPLCIAQLDFQHTPNLLTSETKYKLDFKTELDMDIKPNDEISISFYLSKHPKSDFAAANYTAANVVRAQNLLLDAVHELDSAQ